MSENNNSFFKEEDFLKDEEPPDTRPQPPSSIRMSLVNAGEVLPQCFFCDEQVLSPFSYKNKWVCENCLKEASHNGKKYSMVLNQLKKD